jgi:hypothetical protein
MKNLETLHAKDPNSYWKLIKELREDNDEQDPSTRISHDRWISHFSNLLSIDQKFTPQDLYFRNLCDQSEKSKTFSLLDCRITEKEIIYAVTKLKNNKSAGLDGIKNEMIKAGLSQIVGCLLKLFNIILSTGVYPSDWKIGYLKPLYKCDDPCDTSNYRGLAIMSCLSKVFNSILNARLQTYLDDHKVINKCQIGFQPKARTSDHMFVLKTLIQKYNSSNSKLYTCFIDFSKAFDTVLHSALLYRLCQIDIRGPFYYVIKNMYTSNNLHIRIGNKLTKSFIPELGVRQGDNLSPNLFKILINELPDMFNSEDDQVYLNNEPLSCLLYADDLVLLSSSQRGLQNCLNKLATFCDKYCLTVNLKKTKVVIFYKNARLTNLHFIYKGHEIECTLSYKYLGVLFNASGSFSQCQYDLYKRGLKAFFKLVKCFGNTKPNANILLHLFDHTVKPVVLYGSEIWGTINTESAVAKRTNYEIENSFKKLFSDKLHIKALKYICGVHKKASNYAVMGELGRYPLYIEILSNCTKYLQHIYKSDGTLLASALQENIVLNNNRKSCWLSSIHFMLEQLGISCDNILAENLPSIV